ncbi:MAG TPA: PTS fructose transporter subunit IIA [Acidiferrobacteraceae bacterium]|nr:PTS fructose transporter subunit IIA [Acidiferrobacteraceae bacterium]
MIGILILAPESMGRGLLEAATHILGTAPPQIELLTVSGTVETLKNFRVDTQEAIYRLDTGEGVIILADIFGASHTNEACRLLQPGRVDLVSGVNLPMLVRVLNHRQLRLDALVTKASGGGRDGIVCASHRTASTNPDAA